VHRGWIPFNSGGNNSAGGGLGKNPETQAGAFGPQVVLRRQEETPIIVVGIARDNEGGAGRGNEGNTSDDPAVGRAATTFVQVGDYQDAHGEPGCHISYGFQNGPELRILVTVDLAKVRAHRIDDDQPHVPDFVDRLLKQREVGLQIEGTSSDTACIGHGRHDVHPSRIGTSRIQSRPDGIGCPVLR
jgi:hypothetical protein